MTSNSRNSAKNTPATTPATTASGAGFDIPWDEIDGRNQDFADVFPRIQWQHGKKSLKPLGADNFNYTGGLFLPADQYKDFEAEGWKPASFTNNKGDEVHGYASQRAEIAVIRVKTWWDNSGVTKFSQTQALVMLKGLSTIFSLQMPKVSKGQAFLDAFRAHRQLIVEAANRSRKEGAPQIEPFALWMVLVPGPHSMQESRVKSAESEVTIPTLYVPDDVTDEYVRSLWVGLDNYRLFGAKFRETRNWQETFPARSTGANDEVAGAASLYDLCATRGVTPSSIALKASAGATDSIAHLDVDQTKEAYRLVYDLPEFSGRA